MMQPMKKMLWATVAELVPASSYPTTIPNMQAPERIQGIPVDFKLYNFAWDFLNSGGGYKFGLLPDQAEEMKFRNHPARFLMVYREGDIYVSGIIGYGDVSASGNKQSKYYVVSNNIENNNVDSYKLAHVAKSSTKIDQAVKIARAKILPVPPSRIYQHNKYDLNHNFGNKFKPIEQLMHKSTRLLQDKVFKNEDIRTFESIFNDGVRDPEIKSLLDDASEKLRNYRSIKYDKHDLSLVTVTERNGKPLCTVLNIYSDLSYSQNNYFHDDSSYDDPIENRPTNQFYEDELPLDLAEKLATLNVIEEGDYVFGIGCKFSENIFYVHYKVEG